MKVHAVPDEALSSAQKGSGFIRRALDKALIGHSDSSDYSSAWKEQFSKSPTWCDADMAMQQIRRGKAHGNVIGLYSRSFFQRCLFNLGCFVQRFPWYTVILGIILYTMCCWGLQNVKIETDLVKLWVQEGGRLNDELSYPDRMRHMSRIGKRSADNPPQGLNGTKPIQPVQERHTIELPKENGLGGGFQVVIQTPSYEGENALSKGALLRHVDLMNEVANYRVEVLGEEWKLADICFKPPGPSGGQGPLGKLMSHMLEKIIPCIWITPIDCFWEGSKPLGPDPPLEIGEEVTTFVSSLPKGNVTWRNLNPTAVVKEVGQLFDLGPLNNFFERAGIDGAYLDRWCIDPLDPECPSLSPNFFDRCEALKLFNEWNNALPDSERAALTRIPYEEDQPKDIAESILNELFGRRRKRQSEEKTTPAPKSEEEDYYAYEDEEEYKTDNTSRKPQKDVTCLEYGKGLLDWMQAHPEKWGEFLTEKQLPKYPDYAQVMTGGCRGFGKNIMEWPEDLIIGGIQRENGRMKSAEALQSVFLVASPADVYLRYNTLKETKPNLDLSRWSHAHANEVIVKWQRNFTKNLYKHKGNLEIEGFRQFHPLASTSISDMLEEFSQFNYFIILMGYLLMLVYAAWTQCRIKGRWLAIESNVALAFIGVVWVTYSSISGLGFSTMLGINFNAATTQIVPFLSLGLGIDDLFLLLHNYDDIVHKVHHHEMGVLLKETGMSVLVTSTNNILAFFSGMILPIPALRSFCSQTAILLAFNLVFLMVLFPAYIAIDLKRRRRGTRDLGWCLPSEKLEKQQIHDVLKSGEPNWKTRQVTPSKGTEVSSHAELTKYARSPAGAVRDAGTGRAEDPWYTVSGFLKLHYIPALRKSAVQYSVLTITVCAFVFGLIGMYQSTLGLELSDVLPENTAPAAFLQAREKYFSFYPMSAILKGDELDIPNQQKEIETFREELAKSSFVVRGESGRPQEYWMSLMRTWLETLDVAIAKSIAEGEMEDSTGTVLKGKKPPPEALIGRAMICSVGHVYNCTGRFGRVRLVKSGIINPEGFQNYVTGWYNVDNMMYYVSQASFIPVPPGWSFESKQETLVPPAPKILYAQIPLYLTGLTTTPVIVDMIKEVRAVCERYTENGVAVFPTGIAFTFWEQYLSLRWNLFMAILVIAAAVFTVISVLIFNPYAAAMVMVIVIVITVELGGFMGLFGVKMNPISAVTLICAVGIGVEFTAHVVLAFLTSLGSTESRLSACLHHMFVPVFHGAISTLLGIVMLAFTEFDFVFKYFFVTMSVLVALGIFNGLALLPVLLTFIGPKPELIPLEDPNFLPAPPPLAKQRSELQKYHDLSMETGSLRHRKVGGDVEMEPSSPASSEGSEVPHEFHDSLTTIDEGSSDRTTNVRRL